MQGIVWWLRNFNHGSLYGFKLRLAAAALPRTKTRSNRSYFVNQGAFVVLFINIIYLNDALSLDCLEKRTNTVSTQEPK
jgi:uncharacterized membrane protein